MVLFLRFLSDYSLTRRAVLALFCSVSLFLIGGCRSGSSQNSAGENNPKDISISSSPGLLKTDQLSVKDLSFQKEGDRIIAAAAGKEPSKKIEFISSYFLGRKYRPDTKKRIKKQRKAEKSTKVKEEATNSSPMPVRMLATSFQHLDCMTYVEHVLALASVEPVPSLTKGPVSSLPETPLSMAPEPGNLSFSPWKELFLNRLIDVMFDGQGRPLMNHMRNHFVSMWARKNVKKGYLTDVACGHKKGEVRKITLNKVKENRTFYVEDAFMIFSEPENIYYFSLKTLLEDISILQSGDILALVCDKEGLDVVHMGFFIEKPQPASRDKKIFFRHASYSDNKIIDSEFISYMKNRKKLVGLMVLRPVLKAPKPPSYDIAVKSRIGLRDTLNAAVSDKAGDSDR